MVDAVKPEPELGNDVPSSIDVQTFELGQARLRLRSNLRFTLHQSASRSWYLIEDDARGHCFRIGLAEYAFLSLLDGHRTLDQAQADLASMPGFHEIGENQAAALAKWVIESGLAETHAALSGNRIQKRIDRDFWQQSLQWLNPISWQVPLFNPQTLIQRFYWRISPLCGWPMVFVWSVVCCIGGLTFMMKWDEFWQQRITAISRVDVFWVAVAWLLAKTVHEAAHAMMCRHYGGNTPQFGVRILLFVPLPYVDVTSSWRFPHKYQRVLTAAAGMMAELFIAAIAAVIWSNSNPGPIKYHAGNLVISTSLHTLLFNLNPLMRFDGYHILTDLIEIPNLYTRGRRVVVDCLSQLFLGTKTIAKPGVDVSRQTFIRVYGVASTIWYFVICVMLSVAVITLLNGIGIVVALGAAIGWLGIPIYRFGKYLNGNSVTQTQRHRFWTTFGITTTCLVLGLYFIPAPSSIRAPLVVQSDSEVIRARTSGFLKEIRVATGQQVEANQLLAALDNPELVNELKKVEIEIREVNLRAQSNISQEKIAKWQMEQHTLEGLKKRRHDLKTKVEHLQIRAPIAGVVSCREELSGLGKYVELGDEIIEIHRSEHVKAIALVRQDDANWLTLSPTAPSHVLVYGGSGQIQGMITQIEPQATWDLPHFSFASSSGGPISVVERQNSEGLRSDSNQSLLSPNSAGSASRIRTGNELTRSSSGQSGLGSSQNQNMAGTVVATQRMLVPYVAVEVELTGGSISTLRDGQTGLLLIRNRDESLGQFLADKSSSWLSSHLNFTHGL